MWSRIWRKRRSILIWSLLFVAVLGSITYSKLLKEEDQHPWLAAVTDAITYIVVEWRYSLPDCTDSEIVEQAVELAEQLVARAMPYNIRQPFHLNAIELAAVVEENTDNGYACRAYLEAPHLQRPGQTYAVGRISYTIQEDELRSAGWYVVEAQLDSVNLLRWAE